MLNLLSANDYKALSDALRRMEEITIVRELGDYEVKASTTPAGRGWNVAMLVCIEWQKGGHYERKYSESVEEARRFV